MSKYYNPPKKKNLYDPDNPDPFKLSRSKIDLFVECRKCFYLDIRLGVTRPPGFPFTLNTAVDNLLKQEFDTHRVKGIRHPIMEKYGVDAVPVIHDELESWRNNFTGVQFHFLPANLLIYGAIDDLWMNSRGEYIVVEYKATSVNEEITELNKEWHAGYKRQMEIYQWLLKKNGYTVSETGYFVYCNGKKDLEAFDRKLEFDVTLIPYKGNDNWIDDTIIEIYNCLVSDALPEASPECDYCLYRDVSERVIRNVQKP